MMTLCTGAIAQDDRKAILNALRPIAEYMTQQPVRFVVDRLNIDANWAILVGSLGTTNGPVDWTKAFPRCNNDLDKMFFAVLAKADGRWRPAQVEVCASEPPYWYFDELGTLPWPCGVYAGLDAAGRQLERECRAAASRK